MNEEETSNSDVDGDIEDEEDEVSLLLRDEESIVSMERIRLCYRRMREKGSAE